jgi:hypothetical protein
VRGRGRGRAIRPPRGLCRRRSIASIRRAARRRSGRGEAAGDRVEQREAAPLEVLEGEVVHRLDVRLGAVNPAVERVAIVGEAREMRVGGPEVAQRRDLSGELPGAFVRGAARPAVSSANGAAWSPGPLPPALRRPVPPRGGFPLSGGALPLR